MGRRVFFSGLPGRVRSFLWETGFGYGCPYCLMLKGGRAQDAPKYSKSEFINHLQDCPAFLASGHGKVVAVECPHCKSVTRFGSMRDLASKLDLLREDVGALIGARYFGELYVPCPSCHDRMAIKQVHNPNHDFDSDLARSLHYRPPRLAKLTVEQESFNELLDDARKGLPREELRALLSGASFDDVSYSITFRLWVALMRRLPTREQIEQLTGIVQTIVFTVGANAIWDLVKSQVKRHLQSRKTPSEEVADYTKRVFGLEPEELERLARKIFEETQIQLKAMRDAGLELPRFPMTRVFCVHCGAQVAYGDKYCLICGQSALE